MSEFTRYEVNPGAGPVAVARGLNNDGLVVFRAWSPDAILDVFREVAQVVPHRHSTGVDGVTALVPRSEAEGVTGLAGFTHEYMPPHTDGSALESPPDVIGLACVEPADGGGEAILVDGLEVVRYLADHHPDVLRALTEPRTVTFGEAGHRSSIISLFEDGNSARIRYREDGLADFSQISLAQATFSEVVRKFAQVLTLNEGDGYVLMNARWLHGRTAFTGEREMHRLLGYVNHKVAGRPVIRIDFDTPLVDPTSKKIAS